MYAEDVFFQILNVSMLIQVTLSTTYITKINAKTNTDLLPWENGKQLRKSVMFSQLLLHSF